MWKKIILGVLFAGLVAVLLIGAINRTNSKTQSSGEYSSNRAGGQTRDQNGQGGQGNGNDALAGPSWETFQGAVISTTESELVIQSATGDQLLIGGKAWSYAQEQGSVIQLNDQMTVTGFYEGDEFVAGTIADVTSGQTVLIRDSDGRPLWAGRGGRN